MSFIITTGQFEKGSEEQQAAFIQLFGAEDVQAKFDFYFHWYNIVHEYGHCLCCYYESETVGLKQELLVNDFAAGIWKYAGYEKELSDLQNLLKEILRQIKNPVPADMAFEDYYGQIWGTDLIMQVPVYGYFQFKSVLMALEAERELAGTLRKMGIHKEIIHNVSSHKSYLTAAETAKEVLNDVRQLLTDLGIEQPVTEVELVDDPSIHCVKIAPGR